MKLLNPSEISGKILSLFDESDDRIIIVSPYVRIDSWNKVKKRIRDYIAKGHNLEIYVRDKIDNPDTYNNLDQLGLTYYRIPNLHTKLYMNEKHGIATTMNLLQYSDNYSLELGYITESRKEYEDLYNYYKRFISIYKTHVSRSKNSHPKVDLRAMVQAKTEGLDRKIWLLYEGDVFKINSGKLDIGISEKEGRLMVNVQMNGGTGKDVEGLAGEMGKYTGIEFEQVGSGISGLGRKIESNVLSMLGREDAEYIVDVISRVLRMDE